MIAERLHTSEGEEKWKRGIPSAGRHGRSAIREAMALDLPVFATKRKGTVRRPWPSHLLRDHTTLILLWASMLLMLPSTTGKVHGDPNADCQPTRLEDLNIACVKSRNPNHTVHVLFRFSDKLVYLTS